METITTNVSSPERFNLKTTVLSHGWHECAPMSWCEGGRCLQVVEREGDQVFRVSVVEGKRRAKRVVLNMTIEGGSPREPIQTATAERIAARMRVVLGLDRDLTEFYTLCAEHSILRVLPKIGGGRGLRSACMAENVIKAICGTNVNWDQAVKMINRICQLGPILPHFRSLNAWPTPREILRAGRDYLVGVCRVGYRADSILAFCEDVCEGRFDPAELEAMAASPDVTSDELIKKLRTIRGIGPTSAHYLISFLGRHDRLAIDTSTVAHVARTHTNGKKPTLKQIERIYAKYGKWKNLVWWNEHWLNWSTARQILAEAGLNGRAN